MTTLFTADDLARLPEIVAADLAPDAGSTVYAATTADGSTTLERPQLWWQPVGGTAELLVGSDGAQHAPAFSPDGSRVAFVQDDADGHGQIAVLTLADRSVQVVTDFPRGASAPHWSPDGTTLAFTGNDAPLRDPKRPYRVTRPVWRRDGMGLVDDVATELWSVPAGGGTPTRLTDHGGIVANVQWSPDGGRLLYEITAEPDTAAVALRTVTADGSTVADVMTGDYLVYAPMAAWLSDGRIVRTTAWNVYNMLDLVVHDPATGTDTPLNAPLTGQIGGLMVFGMNSAVMAPKLLVDGDDAVVLYVQVGGRTELHRVSTTDGADTTLWTGDACVSPVALRGDSVLLARTTFDDPASLVVVDLTDGTEQPASTIDRSWLELPYTVHTLHFPGEDGTQVEGWYLEPTVGEGPYATVLHVHGGPFAAHGYGFSMDDHLLTSAGYGVLKVNFRGSSGYGEDFSASLAGDWGHHDAGDCLAGLDHVISLGLADPERLGSFGISGGGYMTSWLLTHSDRFSAGIAEAPVTDWSGMVGSDIPQVVARWLGAGPGEGPAQMAEYARTSPITYAASCTTPMLVIEHESDLRCPTGQGDILYNALMLSGCTTEMLRLPGMFHVDVYAIADLVGRTERLAALTEWFGRHLKP